LIKSKRTVDKPPLTGRGQGHMTRFQFRCSQSYLWNGQSESPTFCMQWWRTTP